MKNPKIIKRSTLILALPIVIVYGGIKGAVKGAVKGVGKTTYNHINYVVNL